jgi:dipeptidyl aminopeptidase/acylaminoacyl peptidase
MQAFVILRWLFAPLLLVAFTACNSTTVAPVPTATVSPTTIPAAAATTQPATPLVTDGLDLSLLTGRIVFDNHDDIWSINADGTGLTRLTDSPWPEFDPAWSPDGTRIAYRSEPHDYPQLWVMNADGSGKQRLASGGFPAWSPDGSEILYAYPGPPAGSRS